MMTPKALDALTRSIEFWRRNAEADRPELVRFHSNPLCTVYWTIHTISAREEDAPEGEHCKGCPVYDWTSFWHCETTPLDQARADWFAWYDAARNRKEPKRGERERADPEREKFRASAMRYVAFLERVLSSNAMEKTGS